MLGTELTGHSSRRGRNQRVAVLARHVTLQRRIEAHRSHDIAASFGGVGKPSEGCAAEEIRPCHLWIESDRFALVFDGILVVMLKQAHIPSFAPYRSRFRLQTDSL